MPVVSLPSFAIVHLLTEQTSAVSPNTSMRSSR